MITIRRADERGFAGHGWLQARHSFSFADYRDPDHMGYRALRVLNEDRIAPASGFGTHPHRDMEIVTWLLAGELEHRDSMGNGGVLRPGDVQYMSAGTGVTHSEINPSSETETHLLQIWLLPARPGGEPVYGQRTIDDDDLRNRWAVLADPDGAEGAFAVRQDVRLHAARLDAGRSLALPSAPDRHAWFQVARGSLVLDDVTLEAGDGAAVDGGHPWNITATTDSEVVAFDLA